MKLDTQANAFLQTHKGDIYELAKQAVEEGGCHLELIPNICITDLYIYDYSGKLGTPKTILGKEFTPETVYQFTSLFTNVGEIASDDVKTYEGGWAKGWLNYRKTNAEEYAILHYLKEPRSLFPSSYDFKLDTDIKGLLAYELNGDPEAYDTYHTQYFYSKFGIFYIVFDDGSRIRWDLSQWGHWVETFTNNA